MNLFKLIFRNIRHYARSWFITLTGVIIGTAILTGALITGDSVKYSLKEIVRMRLGNTSLALSNDRFFRQDLAKELTQATGITVIPLLQLNGVITSPGNNKIINQARIIGVDEGFRRLWKKTGNENGFEIPSDGEVVISENVSEKLNVKPGEFIVVKIPKTGFAPGNAPFVAEKSEMTGMRLKVTAIAGESSGGRFSLDNNQAAPFNVFVPLNVLAGKTGVGRFCNGMMSSEGNGNNGNNGNNVGNVGNVNKLNNVDNGGVLMAGLGRTMQMGDAGLGISKPAANVVQVNSGRIFIEDSLVGAVRKLVPGAKGILTYMVNSISFEDCSTPYSFVVAVDRGVMPVDPIPGQIVIIDWLASDLGIRPGDSLKLSYYVMGGNKSLTETSSMFMVRAVVQMLDDKLYSSLMPDFPGMKNTGNCRDWETGTPVNLDKIRDKDEDYWKRFKGTPKAWISLQDGCRIWKNPFGSLTSFRMKDGPVEQSLTEAVRQLNPATLGLTFRPVFAEGLRAAGNSTDFGELFLSLGSLVVIAGLLLSGLLFSLFLRQRFSEMALFRAVGLPNRMIFNIFFAESALVSLTGSLIGVIVAVGYAGLVVTSLNTLWLGAVNTSSLIVHVTPSSLLTGFLSGVALNLLLFFVVLFRNRKKSLPDQYHLPVISRKISRKQRIFRIISVSVPVAISLMIILGEIVSGRFFPSTAFMFSGIFMMIGIISGIASFLWGRGHVSLTGTSRVIDHSLKNLVLRRGSNITVIILLTLGTFTILVTGLNRKQDGEDTLRNDTGTGGFRLWMETTIPLSVDLNTREGKARFGMEDEPLLEHVRFIALSGVSGDDASCLNLNQVANPELLGVPANLFDKRGSFSFLALAHGIDPKNPWENLEKQAGPGCINGYADQTVITWGLRKKIGDTLSYTDEHGKKLQVRLIGGLANSVFQGKVLVSDSLLRMAFPSRARVRINLVATAENTDDTVEGLLESRLRDQGALVVSTSEKLASFDAVENTYLDVFILLGGFGLIIGTAGFAVMLLRNLRDRKTEIGLCKSLGFPASMIRRMLSLESLFILLAGITAGLVPALAATLPSWVSEGGSTLVVPIAITGIVVINGLAWIHFMVKSEVAKSGLY